MPKEHEMVSLSEEVKQIIYGSVLGDGSLKKYEPYRNARFSFKHSSVQSEYFYWKVNQLETISSAKCVWEQPPTLGKNNMLRYQSLALPPLTEIFDATTKHNKKVVRRKWLNQMTPLALAIWWMDDGSLIKNGRQGVFCVDSFTVKEVKILARYLQVVWGVNSKIYPTGRSNHVRLATATIDDLKKFLKIVAPHIPVKEMLYKICILYKDSDYQQRWVSEIASVSKFDEKVLTHTVNEHKSHMKAFQKKI